MFKYKVGDVFRFNHTVIGRIRARKLIGEVRVYFLAGMNVAVTEAWLQRLSSESYSKAELLSQWLEKYPQDVDHPNLEDMAVADFVEKNGRYIQRQTLELLERAK